MKIYIRHIFYAVIFSFILSSCSYLDLMPDGRYNDENFDDYPKLLRGYVDKVYNSYLPSTYYSSYYVSLSALTDDAVYRSESNSFRKYAVGSANKTGNPFIPKWEQNYAAINYLNLFLHENRGYNTQYLTNPESDLAMRRSLQGDAFGLRAWMYFDLLRVWGGKGTNGTLLGVPIRLEPTEDIDGLTNRAIKRASFDDCVKQILADCDSAYKYLHTDNRDYPSDPSQSIMVTGSARYKTLSKVAIDAIRARLYLMWASPAYNPDGDMTRYEKAAEYAAKVMKHKLEVESTLAGGFKPLNKFIWTDCNSQEIIWLSNTIKSTDLERAFYPLNFGGTATVVPTQELVDAFPMKNGYPITDARGGYNKNAPYKDRDPRFYSAIYHHGSRITRSTSAEVVYNFDCAVGGKDAPGGANTSPTGYYIKKFIYQGWNPYDLNVLTGYHPVFFLRWTQMCLTFAEAANMTVGPNDEARYGYSAKQAIAWLRSRTTNDGMAGISNDPYLEECSGNKDKFDALVRNEWRIETCFEGERYYNLRRWGVSITELNAKLHGVQIQGTQHDYSPEVETINYPSLWTPIPWTDQERSGIVQNEGWSSWH